MLADLVWQVVGLRNEETRAAICKVNPMSEDKDDVMEEDIYPWPKVGQKGPEQKGPEQRGWTTFFSLLGVLFALIGAVLLFLGISWEDSQSMFETQKTEGGTTDINWALVESGLKAALWSLTMWLFAHLLQVLWDIRYYLRGMHERELVTRQKGGAPDEAGNASS